MLKLSRSGGRDSLSSAQARAYRFDNKRARNVQSEGKQMPMRPAAASVCVHIMAERVLSTEGGPFKIRASRRRVLAMAKSTPIVNTVLVPMRCQTGRDRRSMTGSGTAPTRRYVMELKMAHNKRNGLSLAHT